MKKIPNHENPKLLGGGEAEVCVYRLHILHFLRAPKKRWEQTPCYSIYNVNIR